MKKYVFLGLASISLFVLSTCKNPIKELESFQVNLDSRLAEPLVKIELSAETGEKIDENASVTISGDGANMIFDQDGKTLFPVNNGIIDFILSPRANPSKEAPVSFKISVIREGFYPLNEDVFIFDKKQKFTLNLKMIKSDVPIQGVTTKTENLTFSGKKSSDTVSFIMTRHDGVSFRVDYPRDGLVFIHERREKIKIGEKVDVRMEKVFTDTSYLGIVFDSLPIYSAVEILLFKNQVAEEKVITGYNVISNEGMITAKRFAGYKVLDTLKTPIYENRTFFDTIPVQNVRASIYSLSDFREYGFTDEKGNFIDKPRWFKDAVGLPEVYLYTVGSGKRVMPYYLNGLTAGALITCELPTNNYYLFADGMAYSEPSASFFTIKRSIKMDEKLFTFNPANGKYAFSFRDNLLGGRYFLYQQVETGCGFVDMELKHDPRISYQNGFKTQVFAYNSFGSSEFSFNGNEGPKTIRMPAFINMKTTVMAYIDHTLNSCKGNPALYTKELGNFNLCNFQNSTIKMELGYDPTNYLQSITAKPLEVNAKIICPKGNYVVPPTLTIYFWNIGCGPTQFDENGLQELILTDGKYLGQNTILDKTTYVLRYDRTSSTGKPLQIYDTLYFDSSLPSQNISDELTDFYTGTINFSASKGFSVNVDFDNRKLQYDIPMCK